MSPAHARLFDGASPLGVGPTLSLTLPEGPHQLRAEAEGYLPWSEALELEAGATLERTIALTPLPRVSLRVLADPRKGTLNWSGQRVDVGRSVSLPEGRQTLSFQGDGWRVEGCAVNIAAGMTKVKFEREGLRCRAF